MLDKAQRSAQQYRTVQNLPDHLFNAFTWKGVLTPENKLQEKSLFKCKTHDWILYDTDSPIMLYAINIDFVELSTVISRLRQITQAFDLPDPEDDRTLLSIEINTTSQAKLARSGHFNTLPKRPKVDKFKYQYPRKIRKHCS